ncbi:MAG: YigZ family protein [Ekhidna sp.]
MSTYYTIKSQAEGLYKEKGSKFLAFAFPVSSEDQIKQIQDDLRKRYYDARHHCFAWMLGMDEKRWRANDDGEPAHSAGDPILGQIKSSELTNVLVVVIRYFGGIKLGVGGLINAYKIATEAALSKAERQAIYETKQVIMKFAYEAMSLVERLITDFEIDVVKRDFQLSCEIQGDIKKDLIKTFEEKTIDLYTIEFIIEE